MSALNKTVTTFYHTLAAMLTCVASILILLCFTGAANATSVDPMVDGGPDYSVLLNSDGTVWTWGRNNYGQLGNNTTDTTSSPVQVVGPGGVGYLTDITAISAGHYHCLALKSDGTVWAWGSNTTGQLGDATTTASTVPVQVVGPGGSGYLTNIIAIAAGKLHSLALKSDGSIVAWGRNEYGQLGNNTTDDTSTPAPIFNPGGFTYLAISAGDEYSLAVRSDATESDSSVVAWGRNYYGQIGIGSYVNQQFPNSAIISTPAPLVQSVSAECGQVLAVRSDGWVYSWGGSNIHGELGYNNNLDSRTQEDHFTPAFVSGPGGSGQISDVTSTATGLETSFALKTDGTLWAWGYNNYGQLGDGSIMDRYAPVQVHGANDSGYFADVKSIGAGFRHTLAIKSDGTVWAWGLNNYGQLGNGTTDETHTPVQVSITQIDMGIPTWSSGNLSTSSVGQTSLTLSWSGATDNDAVTGYKIYKNGTLLDTVAGVGSYDVTGLISDTEYTFKVEAGDGDGYWSTDGPSVTVTTDASGGGGGPGGGGSIPATEQTVQTSSGISPTTIDPTKDQIVQDSGGSLRLDIPTGAIGASSGNPISVSVTGIAKANLEQLLTSATKPEGFKSINKAYEFKAEINDAGNVTKITKFAKPVTFEVQLTSGDLAGITNPNKVGMFRINDDGSFTFVGGKLVGNKLVVEMNGFSKYVLAEVDIEFQDMAGHWAKADVDLMASKYVVKGADGKFNPSSSVTRAQFAAMLVRAMNLTNESQISFKDVKPLDWFYVEIRKAVSFGIISGYGDGTFRPNDPITREQVASMLARALIVKGKSVKLSSVDVKTTLASYVDGPEVSSWAGPDLALAIKQGILSGQTSKLLAPKAGASRAEAAAMIARYWKK